jgi:hypothetical protein
LTIVDDYEPQGRPAGEMKPAHEAETLRVSRLAAFAAALVGVVILVEAVLALAIAPFSRDQEANRALAPPRFAGDRGGFPDPQLQKDPASDLAKMKEEELNQLNSYGWVDRSAGIAHIPIERAIDIVAKSGLPAPVPSPTGGGSPREAKPSARPNAEARPGAEGGKKP